MMRSRFLGLAGALLIGAMVVIALVRSPGGSASQHPNTAGQLAGTPISTVTIDSWAQAALDYTREHVTIKSGEPVVLLSRPIAQQDFPSLGFQPWPYAPDCQRPMQLVVIKGNFDMRGAYPASVDASVELPASYIGYVYDLVSGGGLAEIMDDIDGATFKLVLGDPTLPDPDLSVSAIPTAAPPYVSCEQTVLPSDPAPPAPTAAATVAP